MISFSNHVIRFFFMFKSSTSLIFFFKSSVLRSLSSFFSPPSPVPLSLVIPTVVELIVLFLVSLDKKEERSALMDSSRLPAPTMSLSLLSISSSAFSSSSFTISPTFRFFLVDFIGFTPLGMISFVSGSCLHFIVFCSFSFIILSSSSIFQAKTLSSSSFFHCRSNSANASFAFLALVVYSFCSCFSNNMAFTLAFFDTSNSSFPTVASVATPKFPPSSFFISTSFSPSTSSSSSSSSDVK
mmetsp:Transcript_33414/g.40032  ORF Transcript_33414/g.40032 Transcript_33414/m.40032 type:complete len:241 (-) Transcript_33414:53-775(-)